MRQSLRNYRRNSGMTLAELCLDLFVFSVILAGATDALHEHSKNFMDAKAATARDHIRDNIQTLARTPAFLQASLNQAGLATCVRMDGKTACMAQEEIPFSLYGLQGMRAAGTLAQPEYYDIKGLRCGAISGDGCEFKATAKLSVACAGGASACWQADSFVVRIDVERRKTQAVGRTVSRGVAVVRNAALQQVVQLMPHLLCESGFVSGFQNSQPVCYTPPVASSFSFSCAGGMLAWGVDSQGKVLCRNVP